MVFLIGASEQATYPVSAVRDGIVFPGTENVLIFGRPKSVSAINSSLKKDKKVVLLMQKNPSIDNPKVNELYRIGVLATIEKTAIGERGEINALVKGIEKVKVVSFIDGENLLEAKVEIIKEKLETDAEIEAMSKHISSQIKKAINLGKTVDFVFLMNILNTTNPINFSNQIAVILDIKPEERQSLLEEGIVDRLPQNLQNFRSQRRTESARLDGDLWLHKPSLSSPGRLGLQAPVEERF